jgi:hypothetical protein
MSNETVNSNENNIGGKPITPSPVISAWSPRSDSIVKVAEALSKAQAEIQPVIKDASNPFYGSKYADLATVWAAIRKPLTDNGLSVIQEPGTDNGKITLTTTLLHSSGEYIRSVISMPVTKSDAQGYGSAITYARRYALQSIAGIAPEDDDGNAAVGQGKQPSQPQGRSANRPVAQATKAPAQPELCYYDLRKVDDAVRDATIDLFEKQGAEMDPDTYLYVSEGPVRIQGAEQLRVQPPSFDPQVIIESTGEIVKESVLAADTRKNINKLKGGKAA